MRHIKTWYDAPSLVGGLLCSSIAINILDLVFPLVLLQIYDRIIPYQSMGTLFLLSLIVISSILLNIFFKTIRNITVLWSDARFDYFTNINLFQKLIQSELSEIENQGIGFHLERIRKIQELKNYYGSQAFISLIDIPFVFLFLSLVAYLGGFLVLIPFCILILLFLALIKASRLSKETLSEKQNSNDRRMNFIIEILQGIHTVKTLAMEPLILRRYERLQDKTSEINYDINQLNAFVQNITTLLSQATIVLVVGGGAILVMNNQLSFGGLAACTLLSARVFQPLSRSIGTWLRFDKIHQAENALASFNKTKAPRFEKNKNYLLLNKVIKGNYQLKKVDVSFDNKEVFKNISFEINPGEMLAITGESLSGKSTLLSLLSGEIKPKEGKLYLDDTPIEQYPNQVLIENIAYIPQNSAICFGTLLENITLFRPELEKEAYEISNHIGLTPLVDQLPDGFYTKLGNAAVETLPMGFNQLISIARELLKKPKIILFDAANDALDLIFDEKIKNILLSYKGSRTIIVATLRPSWLKHADTIMQIQEKKLIKKNKVYQ